MLSRLIVVTVSLLIATASLSSADDKPIIIVTEEADLDPPTVRLDAELASPVGAVAVVVSYPVMPRFTVEFGGGYGFSGVQASLMAKTYWGSRRLRFTPGLGASAGFPLGTRTFNRGHPRGDEAKLGRGVLMRWLDVDALSVEYRPGDFVLSAAAGISVSLRDAHWDIGDEHGDVSLGTVLPQFRIGVGKAF